MKRLIIALIILLFLIGCRKSDDANNTSNVDAGSSEQSAGKVSVETQYCKESRILCYADIKNYGKKFSEIKGLGADAYYFLNFGDAVTVLKEKESKGEKVYQFKNPDDTVYWVKKDALVEKFIVINSEEEVKTYKQPGPSFVLNTKVAKGDLGIYRGEKDGFIKVDFWAYRPAKADGEKVWVGTKWIEKGYTDNIMAAKEAYYLYLAYYREISKNDIEGAINYAEKALEANPGESTEITPVIEKYLRKLKESMGEELPEDEVLE